MAASAFYPEWTYARGYTITNPPAFRPEWIGIVPRSLAALYLFDDVSGDREYDYSGNGASAIFGSGAAPTRVPAGLSFDGGDHVEISQSFAGAFTAMFVTARTDTTHADVVLGNTGGTNRIGFSANANMIYLVSVDGGAPDFIPITGGGVTARSITVTRDGANKVDVSIDGGSFYRAHADAAQSGTVAFNRIGTNGSDSLTGTVSALAFYTANLTATEVARNHAALKALLAAADRGVALS